MKEDKRSKRRALTLGDEEEFTEKSFLKDVDVNLDNLQLAIARNGGVYYKYGKLHAMAIRELDNARLALDALLEKGKTLWAQLDGDIRKKARSGDDPKLTEKAIDSLIRKNSLYRMWQDQVSEMQSDLVEIEFTGNMLALAEKIMSKRTDSLHTLGYMAQSELKSTGNVMSKEALQERETSRLKRGAEEAIKRSKHRRS